MLWWAPIWDVARYDPRKSARKSSAAVVSYASCTMLHTTDGHVELNSRAALMSLPSSNTLYITRGHVDMVSGAAVIFHTSYIVLHITM